MNDYYLNTSDLLSSTKNNSTRLTTIDNLAPVLQDPVNPQTSTLTGVPMVPIFPYNTDYNSNSSLLKKLIKYFLAGLFVALAIYFIRKNKSIYNLTNTNIVIIGIIAAIIFAVMDFLMPTM